MANLQNNPNVAAVNTAIDGIIDVLAANSEKIDKGGICYPKTVMKAFAMPDTADSLSEDDAASFIRATEGNGMPPNMARLLSKLGEIGKLAALRNQLTNVTSGRECDEIVRNAGFLTHTLENNIGKSEQEIKHYVLNMLDTVIDGFLNAVNVMTDKNTQALDFLRKFDGACVEAKGDNIQEYIGRAMNIVTAGRSEEKHDLAYSVTAEFNALADEVKALSDSGVGADEIAQIRRDLGLAAESGADKSLHERSLRPLSRQQVREILDRNAAAINAGAAPGAAPVRTSDQIYGADGMRAYRAGKRDAVNASLAGANRTAEHEGVAYAEAVVAGDVDFRPPEDTKPLLAQARAQLAQILDTSKGEPSAEREAVVQFRINATARSRSTSPRRPTPRSSKSSATRRWAARPSRFPTRSTASSATGSSRSSPAPRAGRIWRISSRASAPRNTRRRSRGSTRRSRTPRSSGAKARSTTRRSGRRGRCSARSPRSARGSRRCRPSPARAPGPPSRRTSSGNTTTRWRRPSSAAT